MDGGDAVSPEEHVDEGERLESIMAIADPRLNRVGASDLMTEMLDRIRNILEVDTVTLLLLDESGERLVAEATCGLEEEVRQGTVVPVGAGFAGTIAAKRKPVMLDHVGPDTVANPILWERGLRTMLGAPMLRDEQLMGVLHVGRLDDRPFSDDDVELLLVAAERVGGAATARQLDIETAAAQRLERSLLPSKFPEVLGAQFAGRYAAADRLIGGDWYDVFTLPTGDLWLVVGDVSGHGLGSAVVMGRVRSALRAYALLGGGPATVLELTDRKVHHFDMGRMTTVQCAVAKPPYTTFEISSAGHPGPVLAVPGEETQLVAVDANVPLGSVPGTHRTATTVDVPLGGVLALYTDGLVERLGESIDDGIDRLRQCTVAEHPEVVCRTVMLRMVGGSIPMDDIALLAMRHTSH